jgi:dihydroneopterin aldolase
VESQRVEDTVDYDWVARLLTDLAQARRYRLIESFAEEGAALLLQQFEDVETVRVEERKPGAVRAAEHAFVRVERSR